MAGALEGLKILVPESRELDLFVSMLEAEGARAVRCPLVRIIDLNDTAEAEAWIRQLIARSFDDAIWLTGEGLRRLVAIAQRKGMRDSFVESLGYVRSITRGPKPVRALRELGLAPALTATEPTSHGVLAALAAESIQGRKIGVQLYPGDGTESLLAQLRRRGAEVHPVTPYRYAAQADTEQVSDAIAAIVDGRIDAVAFTSSPQVDYLFDVADAVGRTQDLCQALSRIMVAAVGPVVGDALARRGIATAVKPQSAFHLKPLVRAIADAWNVP